jgi:hypothetical protein
MDQVFQALIDRSRAPLDLQAVKTILGYKHREFPATMLGWRLI